MAWPWITATSWDRRAVWSSRGTPSSRCCPMPTPSCSPRGVLRNAVDAGMQAPVVLRVSGGTSILKELSNEDITVSIEDAIRLNVSAMALSIFVGSEFEKETLVSLAKLVDEGERYGIPVLAVTAVGKDMAQGTNAIWGCPAASPPSSARTSSRPTTARTSRTLVNSCPIPVIVAGGKKTPGDGGPGAHPQRRGPRRRGSRHGQEHLPVRQPRGHDPGGQSHRPRRRPPPRKPTEIYESSKPAAETGGGLAGPRIFSDGMRGTGHPRPVPPFPKRDPTTRQPSGTSHARSHVLQQR